MTKEQYVRTFDCNTELNNNINFSKMRAVCKDGSSVEMAQAGGSGNISETIYHGGTDELFNTGVEACNSQLKLNSNQQRESYSKSKQSPDLACPLLRYSTQQLQYSGCPYPFDLVCRC